MLPDDRACEMCGRQISAFAKRCCSQDCWHEWRRQNLKPTPEAAARRRAYQRWYRMIDRCTNPANSHWSRYGGRGITVCERWRSFDTYYSDTGDAPAGMSLDRIDNNGPYTPENTRWTTAIEQRANQEYDHMRIKTHCKNGHPFNDENTHVDRRGWRSCRACARAKMTRRRAVARLVTG